MQVYSITEGFSQILYCRLDVVALGNPFAYHEEVLSLQPIFPPKSLDTLPLEVDAQV